MKRKDLERHLREQGCEFLHHGSEHDIWVNPSTLTRAPLPRHREVKRGTVRGICRSLRVPLPRGP